MRNGKLEKRIDQVEYYTSLNMLESDTFNVDVLDATGKNRLKNGFIVDDFTDHSKSSTTSVDYSASLDFEEGADILMIKPAEPYLDVIHYAKSKFNVPIAAYQVSGEYSRIWAAHLQGWLDLETCALESLLSIKRAGAEIIFTYFAERIAKKI